MSEYISPYSLQLVGSAGGDRDQYRKYLQEQSFVKDITQSNVEVQYAISESTREIIATHEQLQQHGFELLESIDSGIATVNDSIQTGFETISYDLEDISDEIASLTAKCNWGFSQMISQIGHVNDTLEQLLSASKTPAQTWAFNQYEIARDAMRRHLFPEALEALLRAINGFGDQTGYKIEFRFHYNLGILYLGDVNNTDSSVLDLLKAEQSFLAAARYAKEDYPFEASISFTAAGWAAYCQNKLKEAENHTLQAIKLDSYFKNGEAYFQNAKILFYTDRPDDAIEYLRKAIYIDRNYMVKAATDVDCLKHEKRMQEMFKMLIQESAIAAKICIDEGVQSVNVMQSWHPEECFIKETQSVLDTLLKSRKEYSTGTYFGFLDASNYANHVKNEAENVIERQQKKMRADIESRVEQIRAYRGSIARKASLFADYQWKEAEDAYGTLSFGGISLHCYEDYMSHSKTLDGINDLYRESQAEAERAIKESIKEAGDLAFLLGAIKGGLLGILGGLILGAIFETIVGRENHGTDIGYLVLLICIVISAIIIGSKARKDAEATQESKLRNQIY